MERSPVEAPEGADMFCRRPSVALVSSILVAALLCGENRAAAADEATLDQILTLNKDAVALYRGRKHDAARELLLDAEMLAETNGLLEHQVAALTFLHLGLVHLQGLNQRPKGLRYFAQALQIQPSIRPAPALARANVMRALKEAKRRQKQLLTTPAPEPSTQGKDKEQPLAAAPAPAAPDADVEDRGYEPLDCPVPAVAPPREEMEVHCRVTPDLRAERAFLFYRASGQQDYTALRMTRDGKDGYTASIPAGQMTGSALEFYVEAEEAEGHVTGSHGNDGAPRVVTLKRGAPPAARLALADMRTGGALLTGDAPPDLEDRPRRRTDRADSVGVRRAPGSFFLGLGVGSGLGAHLSRNLEHHPGKKVSTGLAGSGLLHVMPELGIQYDEKLALSLQSRHQYIPTSGGPDSAVVGPPRRTAHALLARIHYELWGGERFQFLTTATVGGGSGFRLKIAPAPQSGLAASDTVLGGPLVLGPGATLFVNFTDSVLLAAEIRLLAGFDKFAALAEGSLGLQYAF
jgi:hypothetical protein